MIDIETTYFEQVIYFDTFEDPLNKRCMYGMSLSIFFPCGSSVAQRFSDMGRYHQRHRIKALFPRTLLAAISQSYNVKAMHKISKRTT